VVAANLANPAKVLQVAVEVIEAAPVLLEVEAVELVAAVFVVQYCLHSRMQQAHCLDRLLREVQLQEYPVRLFLLALLLFDASHSRDSGVSSLASFPAHVLLSLDQLLLLMELVLVEELQMEEFVPEAAAEVGFLRFVLPDQLAVLLAEATPVHYLCLYLIGLPMVSSVYVLVVAFPQ